MKNCLFEVIKERKKVAGIHLVGMGDSYQMMVQNAYAIYSDIKNFYETLTETQMKEIFLSLESLSLTPYLEKESVSAYLSLFDEELLLSVTTDYSSDYLILGEENLCLAEEKTHGPVVVIDLDERTISLPGLKSVNVTVNEGNILFEQEVTVSGIEKDQNLKSMDMALIHENFAGAIHSFETFEIIYQFFQYHTQNPLVFINLDKTQLYYH
ncbi:MAG: hypothetical protein ACK5NA_11665 [Enterococcus sp.]